MFFDSKPCSQKLFPFLNLDLVGLHMMLQQEPMGSSFLSSRIFRILVLHGDTRRGITHGNVVVWGPPNPGFKKNIFRSSEFKQTFILLSMSNNQNTYKRTLLFFFQPQREFQLGCKISIGLQRFTAKNHHISCGLLLCWSANVGPSLVGEFYKEADKLTPQQQLFCFK